MKPGYKTTELWMSLVVVVCATVLLVLHDITRTDWTTIAGSTGGVYVAARNLLKSKLGDSTPGGATDVGTIDDGSGFDADADVVPAPQGQPADGVVAV